jgi:hypothetical protein
MSTEPDPKDVARVQERWHDYGIALPERRGKNA